MNAMRKVFYIVWILILGVLCSRAEVQASTMLLVEIEANSLNVEDIPSEKGNIISSLTKGDQVVATTTGIKGWLMILVKDKPGYISAKYTKVLKVISSEGTSNTYDDEEEIKCNANTAKVNLDIVNVDFKCKKDLLKESFESCAAWFNVGINSDCKESLKVFVECQTEFKYETQDGLLSSRATESNLESVYLTHGYGNTDIEVRWRTRLILDRVISVKLDNSSCFIYRVYD